MKKFARLETVPPEIQAAFLDVWIEHKHLPLMIGDRPTTARALRLLLPRADVREPIRLYRGTSRNERRRRLYGFSWTKDVAIAERFAALYDHEQLSGGVVLQTVAPSEAILLVREREDYYDEDEVVVDPYRLGSISALVRGRGSGAQ